MKDIKNLEKLVKAMGIKILGSGKALPQKKVLNDDFKDIETSDEWISTRTGIKSRYFCEEETTSSLATIAAKNAILESKIDVSKIKLVIVATMTPDNFTPAVSQMILENLGIEAMAFDINVACSGFVYALNIAYKMLNDNDVALVIGAESVSKILDFKDRSTCVLFGDGAGALLFEKNDKKALFYSMSKTDTNHILEAKSLAYIKPNDDIVDYQLKMKGTEVFRFALDAFKDSIADLVNEGIDISSIDLIIPHQANKRIIESVSKKFNIDSSKFFLNLDKYGNTSSASIGIALDEAIKENALTKGMKVLLVGFGSGLAWGYVYMEL